MNYLARALEQEEEEREDALSPGLEMKRGFGLPVRQSVGRIVEDKAGGREGTGAGAPGAGKKEIEETEELSGWGRTLGEEPHFLPGRRAFTAETEKRRARAGDDTVSGWAPLVREEPGALALAVRRAERGRRFVQQERRRVQVTLPEEVARSGGGITLEELDRAVERDSWRYEGESGLY